MGKAASDIMLKQPFSLNWMDAILCQKLNSMSIDKNSGFLVTLLLILSGYSCSKEPIQEDPGSLQLSSVSVGTVELSLTGENMGMATNQSIVIRFASPLDTSTVKASIQIHNEHAVPVPLNYSYVDDFKTVSLFPLNELSENSVYRVVISNQLKGSLQESFEGLSLSFTTLLRQLVLQSLMLGSSQFYQTIMMKEIEVQPDIILTFSHTVATDELMANFTLSDGIASQSLEVVSTTGKSHTIKPVSKLSGLTKYNFSISGELVSETGNPFNGFQGSFYTMPDSTPKFPVVSDDELLTIVQRQTFKYFWDFGHPVSGLARERNTSGETVTSGGSGFGLMAILVGIERGFISRSEGVDRIKKIVGFLENADRFHGAWSHWLNGTTGKVQPFSTKDDGGDLVETSYLVAGLLTARQYLNPVEPGEKTVIDQINALWNSIEWNWYTQGGKNVLYWHWSPKYQWQMNHRIEGYNEALITYVLAASSPSHAINPEVYHQGWARNGGIRNGKEFYGYLLPVGYDYGGPLFFAHYSFLGIDPHNLQDDYANYWLQNLNHTQINRAYCIDNPLDYIGYYPDCWGLTASDGNDGYSAHSPTNDQGVITPTAAISSIPYTPENSIEAIKFFYYTMGDKLWGDYGFYDAFNPTESWIADSFLAIDQGPVIIMIENYRTGLLWNLFMSCPEVQHGLTELGFIY